MDNNFIQLPTLLNLQKSSDETSNSQSSPLDNNSSTLLALSQLTSQFANCKEIPATDASTMMLMNQISQQLSNTSNSLLDQHNSTERPNPPIKRPRHSNSNPDQPSETPHYDRLKPAQLVKEGFLEICPDSRIKCKLCPHTWEPKYKSFSVLFKGHGKHKHGEIIQQWEQRKSMMDDQKLILPGLDDLNRKITTSPPKSSTSPSEFKLTFSPHYKKLYVMDLVSDVLSGKNMASVVCSHKNKRFLTSISKLPVVTSEFLKTEISNMASFFKNKPLSQIKNAQIRKGTISVDILEFNDTLIIFYSVIHNWGNDKINAMFKIDETKVENMTSSIAMARQELVNHGLTPVAVVINSKYTIKQNPNIFQNVSLSETSDSVFPAFLIELVDMSSRELKSFQDLGISESFIVYKDPVYDQC